jgi:hypothetical protein
MRKSETLSDFRARIARMIPREPDKPKSHAALLRPKGSQPTPSEVRGGAKLRKLAKPPKAIAKWLKANGVKI